MRGSKEWKSGADYQNNIECDIMMTGYFDYDCLQIYSKGSLNVSIFTLFTCVVIWINSIIFAAHGLATPNYGNDE